LCPATPQTQGLSETASRGGGLPPVQRGLARCYQPFKPAGINVISLDGDHVAAATPL
jgi:hypothetical protein